MRPNLIPTAIVDRNGKRTTVHRAVQQQEKPAVGALSASKPVASGRQQKAKLSKVTWDPKALGAPWGTDNELDANSFLVRAGLEQAALTATPGGKGSTSVPIPTLFDYLRLGITPEEGAVLETLGTLEEWREDPAFNDALPGPLCRQRRRKGEPDYLVEVDDAVGRIEAAGLSPKKATALLENGLSNKHFQNTELSDEQVIAVFSRFKYQPSTVGAETNAAATIDAILDGRLPWRVADKDLGIRRVAAARALALLYPETMARGLHENEKLEPSDRDWILADPDRVLALSALLSSDHRGYWMEGVAEDAITALRTFGTESTLSYPGQLLLADRGDGRLFGPEGAQEALDFAEDLRRAGVNLTIKGDSAEFWGHGQASRGHIQFGFADVLSARDAGVSNEQIMHWLGEGRTMAQIRYLAADGGPSALSSGAL